MSQCVCVMIVCSGPYSLPGEHSRDASVSQGPQGLHVWRDITVLLGHVRDCGDIAGLLCLCLWHVEGCRHLKKKHGDEVVVLLYSLTEEDDRICKCTY